MKKSTLFGYVFCGIMVLTAIATGFYYGNLVVVWGSMAATFMFVVSSAFCCLQSGSDSSKPVDFAWVFQHQRGFIPFALAISILVAANCLFVNPSFDGFELENHGVWVVNNSRVSMNGHIWAVPFYDRIEFVQTWRNASTEVIAQSSDGQRVRAIIIATLKAQPTEQQILSGDMSNLTEEFRSALHAQMQSKITENSWADIRRFEVNPMYCLFQAGYNALDEYNKPETLKPILARANAAWDGTVCVSYLQVMPQ